DKTEINRLVDRTQRIVWPYAVFQHNSVMKQLCLFPLNWTNHARSLIRNPDSFGPFAQHARQPGVTVQPTHGSPGGAPDVAGLRSRGNIMPRFPRPFFLPAI